MKLFHIVAGALVLTGLVSAQGVQASATATVEIVEVDKPYVHKQLYPLSVCIVSDEELEGDSVKTFEVDGRTYKTCCGKCQKKVVADPETYAQKLDAAIIAQQLASYPLEVCAVSGKKLGSMGEPVKLVLEGTLVQLCCKGCNKRAIAAAAEKAEMVLDAAFQKQLAAYPMKTCVVGGHELGDDAVSVMYGTTLVRFCCEGCTDDFEAAPAKFLAKIEAARSADAPKAGAAGHGEKHGETAMASMQEGCGTTCISGVTGGCCSATTATTKPAGGCCSTTTTTTAKPAGGCCSTTTTATAKASGGCCETAPATKPTEAKKKVN